MAGAAVLPARRATCPPSPGRPAPRVLGAVSGLTAVKPYGSPTTVTGAFQPAVQHAQTGFQTAGDAERL